MELGDEERLLPTDLLNDDEDFESPNKIPLRKTWSWTPEKQIHFEENSNSNDENCVKTKKPELRQLERAIKSLSIDPNMSISRKF